jgi:hypothetical protein
MKRLILLTLLASTSFAPIHAATDEVLVKNYFSGEQMVKRCRAYLSSVRNNNTTDVQGAYDSGQCLAYVAGAPDTLFAEAIVSPRFGFPAFCFPNGLTIATATEIVANFLDKEPKYRTEPAYFSVRRALAAAYPCP